MKVRGVVPSLIDAPALDPCVVLEAGANPAVVISAVQLTKEYDDDPAATIKKYKDKYLIVEGEVVDKNRDALGPIIVYLKGDEDTRLPCKLAQAMRHQGEGLKPGQTIKVMGPFGRRAEGGAGIEVSSAFLIK